LSKTGLKIYNFHQHPKKAKKCPTHYISGKQFQKGKMATLFHRFGQTKFPDSGLILDSTQFLILP